MVVDWNGHEYHLHFQIAKPAPSAIQAGTSF